MTVNSAFPPLNAANGSGSNRIIAVAPTTTKGAASPMILLIARILPVIIPGIAEGNTWSLVTCHLVQPTPYADSLRDLGTLLSASWPANTMIGIAITPIVKPATRTEGPRPQPIPPCLTKIANPNIPKTIEGTPARFVTRA